jgi:hypothetical protein
VRWRARAATIVATCHNFTSTPPELRRHLMTIGRVPAGLRSSEGQRDRDNDQDDGGNGGKSRVAEASREGAEVVK